MKGITLAKLPGLRRRDKLITASKGDDSNGRETYFDEEAGGLVTDTERDREVHSMKLVPKESSRVWGPIDEEALRLHELARDVIRKDDFSRAYNKKIRIWHAFLSGVGIICLVWPSLLLFDFLLFLILADHVEALQYTSQETSFLGTTSRVCLKLVKLARHTRVTNKESHGVFSLVCCGSLVFLLLLLRWTANLRSVMTDPQRQEVELLIREIEIAWHEKSNRESHE